LRGERNEAESEKADQGRQQATEHQMQKPTQADKGETVDGVDHFEIDENGKECSDKSHITTIFYS
jgi:hypothetical protein